MPFISDFKTCFDELLGKLLSVDPIFISRIGGSDTAAVVDYLRVKDEGPEALSAHVARYMPLVSKHNGFYDLTGSVTLYPKYCEELIRNYQSSETLLFCNYQLLSLYFKDVLSPVFYKDDFENKEQYRAFIEHLLAKMPALRCFPYQFVEKVVLDDFTLFRAFSVALAGKTVLVVSPFSESIDANFWRRHTFFGKKYRYPEFQLKLLSTPITYSGLPAALYPDTDWFSTLEALRNQISALEFDIALLSCGSYAMPLGVHIERTLLRKAVYVGGVLQLFFGIMGRRYDNPFFLDQINAENFIYPLERERYLKFITIHEKAAKEAFGAYF
jgi:hypothetical protein